MNHQELELPIETEMYAKNYMVMLPQEIMWAHEIKDAIAQNEELHPLSDLEIAQFAIVTSASPYGGDPFREQASLVEVMERISKLQHFREQYKLDQHNNPITVEQGLELLHLYIRQQQPGHLVTIDYLPTQEHYMLVWDRAAFQPSRVIKESDWKVYQGATYVIFLILNSHIRAIRTGVEVVLECDGMSAQNYDTAFETRRVNELFNYYPFITKEFHFLNTPTAAILLYQVCKPFLKKSFHQQVKLDARLEGYEGQRIDSLYNIPSFENAQDRLLQRLEGYLRERIFHQQTFKLPPKPSQRFNDTLNMLLEVPGILDAPDIMLAEEADDSESIMSIEEAILS